MANGVEVSREDIEAYLYSLDLGQPEQVKGIDFCDAWPVVRVVLEKIKEKANGATKFIIKWIIELLDAYYEQKCS